jgi:hypothetical protein
MGQGSDFKVDFKAAGNRALKEWGALFERCDGGQGSKRGVGRQCAQELRGGLRTSTAADAGDVCSDGVKGKLVLRNWRGGFRGWGGGGGGEGRVAAIVH